MLHLSDGYCRAGGQVCAHNLPALFERGGTIPGAIAGSIPEHFAASRPIYFEGPVTLDQFLMVSNTGTNNLDMRPSYRTEDAFLWPSTSRFSFVSAASAFAFALLAALFLSATAKASDRSTEAEIAKPDMQNMRLAQKMASRDTQQQGRVISFVCGRPNTLQMIAPIDLPDARPVRFLPQGASPIAEMKYMPAAKKAAPTINSKQVKPDTASTDRVYQKLLKLSLNDPVVYQTEAQSLITYFSILTGGQDQKRTEQLEKILTESMKDK